MTDQKSYFDIIKAQNLKCPCRGLDDYCACNNVVQDALKSEFDWEDLADDIAEAISDSIDMDWSPRIGARYVVEMLKKRNPPLPDTDTREG